ncbi:MAG TPA: sulfur carrier protein ThiS [Hyphomicrobiaceae bacterium]|jgi:sulfur carrier protein
MQPDRQSRIAIRLNGERLDTDTCTLAELVASQGFAATAVATAVNGAFVPREARVATLLTGGDEVEIVAPRQGG